MPYRELPADFEQRYNSAYIEPIWFDIADGDKVGQFYNATLDEMLYAAKAGLHGLCTNQHHQNVYGFMSNPSIMGAVLARATNGENVAIIQLGSTLPSTTPPTRIAEEYAMLDCISGGRLIAGFPTGLPADAVLSNGVVPIEQRERYREALALVTKAWSAREVFAWNGKHYQLGMVNLWPRRGERPLLGHLRAQGPRRQSISLQLPAAHRRRRHRRRGRAHLRPARRIFLQQAAVLGAALPADSRLPGI
jgi:alkanesulfonate monooxygenase SsuD/methylene tetrahydromethanopterin reductase-like flavin-dependent oxidoreductase (luciferase family)